VVEKQDSGLGEEMSMNETVLFIGGNADGHRIAISENTSRCNVKGDFYRRFWMGNFGEEIRVFVVDGTDQEKVAHLLIDGYRRPVKQPV
jgi:hypothetical protein